MLETMLQPSETPRPHPSGPVLVLCDICFSMIGKVDPSDLHLPLTGAMFKSQDEKHGYPPPFNPLATWQFFKCPHGQHRPFVKSDEITILENGKTMVVVVRKREDPALQESVQSSGTQNTVSPPLQNGPDCERQPEQCGESTQGRGNGAGQEKRPFISHFKRKNRKRGRR